MIKTLFALAALIAAANAAKVAVTGTDCSGADGKGAPACWKMGPGCVYAVGPTGGGLPTPDGKCEFRKDAVGKSDVHRVDKQKYKNVKYYEWEYSPAY